MTHVFAAFTSLCFFIMSIGPANANTVEKSNYQIALAGVPIGDMEIAVRQDGNRYEAQLEGNYRVLFWSGALSSHSTGLIAQTGPSPKRFETSSRNNTPSTTVIEFQQPDGPVAWRRTPPAPTAWTEGRLPLEEEHLRTALDPVSALAASALGSVDREAPDVCRRAVRIFTGTTVFELDFKGFEPSEQSRVTCAVVYRPLSGHRSDSSSVARLSQPGSVKIEFERLPSGTWMPAHVAIRTRLGTLVVERT